MKTPPHSHTQKRDRVRRCPNCPMPMRVTVITWQLNTDKNQISSEREETTQHLVGPATIYTTAWSISRTSIDLLAFCIQLDGKSSQASCEPMGIRHCSICKIQPTKASITQCGVQRGNSSAISHETHNRLSDITVLSRSLIGILPAMPTTNL